MQASTNESQDLSKKEMELLLKHGAYHVFKESVRCGMCMCACADEGMLMRMFRCSCVYVVRVSDAAQAAAETQFSELDIDAILERSSRVVKVCPPSLLMSCTCSTAMC